MFQTNVVDKNKHFVFSNLFPENGEVYEISAARQATGDNIIWRMRFSCWITQVYRHIDLEYVILTALSQQQRLGERVSISRSYVHCLACCETW